MNLSKYSKFIPAVVGFVVYVAGHYLGATSFVYGAIVMFLSSIGVYIAPKNTV